LLVLDIAGTTVRDTGQVVSAFVAGLAEHGIEVTPQQVNGVRGASKRQAILELTSEGPDRLERAARAYQSFRQELARSYRSNGVEPILGAEMTFSHFRTRGVRVALNTGFDRDITDLLLDALTWRQGVVDAVICGDDVKQGRPAPFLIIHAMEATGITNVREVGNVGDTTLDLQAGCNAGVRWNIGVLSGAHDRQQLENAPHTDVLSSITELLKARWD